MGLFYETLQVAALKCGYKNYIEAPYLLGLQFKGWDDAGNVSVAKGSSRLMPVKIINSTLCLKFFNFSLNFKIILINNIMILYVLISFF